MAESPSQAPVKSEDTPRSVEKDAEYYKSALSHLEGLQDKIDLLRTTIPSLIQPMTRRGATNREIVIQVRKAALQATQNLTDIKTDWTSAETKRLLDEARESLERDGDLKPADEVARYGWRREED